MQAGLAVQHVRQVTDVIRPRRIGVDRRIEEDPVAHLQAQEARLREAQVAAQTGEARQARLVGDEEVVARIGHEGRARFRFTVDRPARVGSRVDVGDARAEREVR